ncbi:MAG: DUF1499 domain-containing protein [Gammaproteobacteria bacterium]|nr:DUF1499 domain-containing protein [Gammaproteobacteria bacterium]
MGVWLRRFSLLLVLGFPIAVLGTRLQIWDYGVGLKIVAVTFLLAIAVLVSGGIIYFWQRRLRPGNAGSVRSAMLIALLPILFIGWQILGARSVPPIHNISTDVVDPPQFTQIASIRSSTDNPLHYDAEQLAAVQQAAYPNVKTLLMPLTMEEAHRRAVVVAEALEWEIIDHDAQSGRLEATITTPLWQFKDDVVVRIRPQGDKVAVDLRSVSRVGKSDLGANAARIERFLKEFSKKP